MTAPRPSRVRAFAAAALLAAFVASGAALAGEVLEVRLSESVAGALEVGVRDAKGQVPVVKVAGNDVEVQASAPVASKRWQPLVIMVDTANMAPDVLERVKTNVENVVKAQFEAGAQLVVVGDQIGNSIDLKDKETALTSLREILGTWSPVPVPDGAKVAPTDVADFLPQALARSLVPRGRAWALVYSSLCVPEGALRPDLSNFKGPVTFFTWDSGLDKSCVTARDAWLAAVSGDNKVVLRIDKAEDKDAVGKALQGLQIDDATITLTGWEYPGGPFGISVGFTGEENPWTGSFTDEVVPQAWIEARAAKAQAKSKLLAGIGLAALVAVLLTFALVKARAGAAEVEKWEAVGDPVDLSSQLDPDAWNATIFQLTGAMPVLKDIQAAAQLGPASQDAKPTAKATPEQLVGGPLPPEKKAGKTKEPKEPKVPDDAGATMLPGSGPASSGDKKTGMTVAMPVLDDGTGYEAEQAYEIGVLLSGKPVARKTKKFRKVFSVGRATDNRVVIQKDDTVHRYHVVVRPALQGKEWWLEVSPTATNRTNLNGKDLRAGGRYRLPNRFRLQLGEATEIRGRLADGT